MGRGCLHPSLVGTRWQRVALVAVCGSAVKEKDCNLDRQKQNSSGEGNPEK